MAAIVKFSGYYVEPLEDCFGARRELTHMRDAMFLNGWFMHLHEQAQEIGHGNLPIDDPLDKFDCDLAECEKYFPIEKTVETFDRERPQPGQKYRHFKKGKIVEIVGIGKHSENPDAFLVVYKCPDGGLWCRPLDMFMSEVDRAKYPNAKQKYRFELVKGEVDE